MRLYRLLIVWLALVVAFGVMPAAAAGDGVLPAGLQVAGEEELEEGEESDEDKDPIDVHDQQPPSAELAAESEPVPQGDADGVLSEIADLRQLVREAQKRPSYVVFEGW